MNIKKTTLPASTQTGNKNIKQCEPIDSASWLWHPERSLGEVAFLRFKNEFKSDGTPLIFHISADQHYILFLDGKRIARGPDRSDVEHWSYATFEVELSKGEHIFEVAVWWLGKHAPLSMMTYRGGFVFKADGIYDAGLTTGQGDWQVVAHDGWSFEPSKITEYHVIGDSLHIDGGKWHAFEEDWQTAKRIRGPVVDNPHGLNHPGGWRLYPSTLPRLTDNHICKGKIRAVVNNYTEEHVFLEESCGDRHCNEWQKLIDSKKEVVIQANSNVTILWDFEDYLCGFHQVNMSGGKRSFVSFEWAESLYESDGINKGNRNEIIGKKFFGFGNSYTTDGNNRNWIPHWVCSGRYVLLQIKTKDEPLTIKEIAINEVRYPLEQENEIDTGRQDLQNIIPLCVKVLQSCSHDHLVDCPYYEQMMYVGDTRLELLAIYSTTIDSRLPERCINLFDYSRRAFGFVAERYTARDDQMSTTFAAIWVMIVRDYALWRDNPKWVKERMIGVRANLDCFLPYRGDDGLVRDLPGWSFIDWVKEWDEGYGPGHQDGLCGLSNLFYILSLKSAAELEEMNGDRHLAEYYHKLAAETVTSYKKVFYNKDKLLFADDKSGKYFSQHSQVLAILAGVVSKKDEKSLMQKVISHKELSQCSIYFKYYLFEALYRCDMGVELLDQYKYWSNLKGQGLYTTVESFEPTRSDCHAWGSHAFFHMSASLVGARPASASFATVRVAPLKAGLPILKLSMPHPKGTIEVALKLVDEKYKGTVTLPGGVQGDYIFGKDSITLGGGVNKI